ncbi:MAG: hypothetical protein FJ319_05620 [SAR202 cluster bacterium]|nr:hypothetical protein [SAR202 cluster bacterium]
MRFAFRSGRVARALLLPAAILVLSIVACSGDESPAAPNGTAMVAHISAGQVEAGAPVVRFTDAGFEPKRLDVTAGQAVWFVNDSSKKLWPASSIHPTHQIYPEFDAKDTVPPGSAWSFTFDKPGFWRYHNHMAPEKGALVVVTGGEEFAPEPLVINSANLNFEPAGNISLKDYVALFKDDVLLHNYLEKYGPAQVTTMLFEYASERNVLCHDRAHQLGHIAYAMYGASAFALTGHECEAGAYHGATEALFRDRGTVNLKADVETLCNSATSYFNKLNCLHGVGHGLMAWTSYELYDALGLCDQLGEDRDRRACYSGIFMENVVGGLAANMGHTSDYISDDPHFPCDAVGEQYLGPCYLYQTTRMLGLFKYNYGKVAEACAETPNIVHHECFESYGRDIAAVTLGEPAKALKMCQDTVEDQTSTVYCVQGAVQARFWEVERAPEALEMCHIADVLDEKRGCYTMIVLRAKELYSRQADFWDFCAKVEEPWASWCKRQQVVESGT